LFSLSQNTFDALIRERILYNILFVSVFLLFMGYLAALLVIGRPDRVMLHFGTLVNAIAVFTVATSAGARHLRFEIEERTAYLTLARPVHRSVFYFSKWIGLMSFVFFNLMLLTLTLSLGLFMVGGHITLGFFQSVGLVWAEASIAGALALLFSMFLKPGLASMCTLAYLFIGHNHEQLSFLNQKQSGNLLFTILQGATPDLSVLLMDTRVFYEMPLSAEEFLLRALMGAGYGLCFVLVGNAVFFRKNL
jgi:hypothetical protein